MHARPIHRSLLLLAVAALAACSDPLSPFQPEVTSATDNFQLQATNVTALTSTITYDWANTGTRASVNHSTVTTAGSAAVVVRDAAGTIVYSKTLSPSLNEPTTVGVAGGWKIELVLTNYSGTINFRVQKL